MPWVLDAYDVKHFKSTPYNPAGNGQAEASNKVLLKILSKMVHDHHQYWANNLPLAVWAYRTSRHSATQMTPFSLVYGEEAVVPAEIMVPSTRMRLTVENNEGDRRVAALEAIDDKRELALYKLENYHRRVTKAYEKTIIRREFQVGDMVLRATHYVRANLPAPKFSPNWEGPYLVKRRGRAGHYYLQDEDSEVVINGRFQKLYYP